MTEKSNHKMAGVRSKIIWSVVMVGIFLMLGLAIARKKQLGVDQLEVQIVKIKGDRNMISAKEVDKIFADYLGYQVSQATIKNLNTRELEDLLMHDGRIKRAEVFVDSNGKLRVWILQKQPVVRIFDDHSSSYYLDEVGDQIMLPRGKTVRVPIATGFIDLYDPTLFKSEKESRLKDVLTVSNALFKDEFLNSLIEQIIIDEEKQIILIPKIGRQKILLGDIKNLDEKLYNLKVMYKEGLPREGWNKFTLLKLNFKGQVVAEF